ncbi:MAG: hypothetical protein ABSG53_02680 [Thermoguttaceae bacterium]|jgi:hypothetical protein
MIVPNALSGLSDLASLAKRSDTAGTKAAVVGKAAPDAQSSPPTATAAMREILSHYDMTDITPSDFSKLIQQLSDKGTISQKDVQELSSIRVDLENADVGPDESVNLLDFYQEKIAKVQDASVHSPNPGAGQPNIDLLVGRLNWLQKFAAVRQQGGQSGVNAVA